jgi:hypothetical protein
MNRIPLFRFTPGYRSDPLGLDLDDNNLTDPVPAGADDGPDWLQFTMGSDNPFFDIRRPGDPGGVGFYKVHSQVQLFDSTSTGLAINMQAVTPAGVEMDGVNTGQTVFIPSFALFHALEDGTAFHGFVGKNLPFAQGWSPRLGKGVQYGMAVQRPVLPGGIEGLGNFYFFVEALGRVHTDADTSLNSPANLELLPGLHWRVNEKWWISSGLVFPMGPSQVEGGRLWQITCSFQF